MPPAPGSSETVVSGFGGSRAAAGSQHPIPPKYTELLDRFVGGGQPNGADGGSLLPTQAADLVGDGSEDRTTENEFGARDFWRAARKLARERLEALGNDPRPWERRVAELHESLWVEELGVAMELSRFRFSVHDLRRNANGLYMLDVADVSDGCAMPLEENGLLRGVRVLVRCSANSTHWASVQPGSGAGTLLLAASPALEAAMGPFEIELHPLRFQQVAMHRALEAPKVEGLLQPFVPDPNGVPEAAGPSPGPAAAAATTPAAVAAAQAALPPSLNNSQRQAVVAALLAIGSSGAGQKPLVIWGPPGTGKTTLAAFIIWHLVQQRPADVHILAAAPSNTGADVICKKLAKLGLGEDRMLRLNALGRSAGTVPEEIRKFCAYKAEGSGNSGGLESFVVPPLKELQRFKVVVTTCICAAHIANVSRTQGSGQGWFSHVIVDEAGEATEPETLVPLSLMRTTAGSAVLLGDHFQLGPLVLSSLAKKIGSLEASMIERLANERFKAASESNPEEEGAGLCRDMLEACEEHGLFFLTESYRSHKAIMSFYSRLFYGDQLEHCSRQHQLQLLPFFEGMGLPAPIIFHNVVGRERRDPDSASPYNVEEARIVQHYLEDVLGDRTVGIDGRDIGVITPYARQVRAVEQQLRSLGPSFATVDCGTVEKFQGQERRLIILSTVRSSRHDTAVGSAAEGENTTAAEAARRPIGFLADPKRLNVAISRAVAGLVIIGDLRMLATHSPHWRAIVKAGKELGVIRGEPFGEASVAAAAVRPTEVPLVRPVPTSEATAAWDVLTD